jgi:hypothetical protein
MIVNDDLESAPDEDEQERRKAVAVRDFNTAPFVPSIRENYK